MNADKMILNHSLDDVFFALNVGRTKGYELINSGALKSVKIGTRRVVPHKSLLDFQETLENEGAVQ